MERVMEGVIKEDNKGMQPGSSFLPKDSKYV